MWRGKNTEKSFLNPIQIKVVYKDEKLFNQEPERWEGVGIEAHFKRQPFLRCFNAGFRKHGYF